MSQKCQNRSLTPGSFVKIARPEQTIQQAAMVLAEIDAGLLPVGDNDRMVGKITDRDIAVRAVANGKGPQTLVRDVMTKDVKSCFEDEDEQVRRLPIVNRTSVCSASSHLPMLPPAKAGNSPAPRALHGIANQAGAYTGTDLAVPLMPTAAPAEQTEARTRSDGLLFVTARVAIGDTDCRRFGPASRERDRGRDRGCTDCRIDRTDRRDDCRNCRCDCGRRRDRDRHKVRWRVATAPAAAAFRYRHQEVVPGLAYQDPAARSPRPQWRAQ